MPILRNRQRGISLTGLIAALVVLGIAGLLAMRILPAYAEYRAVSSAIVKAKAAGSTPQEVRASFDRSAEANYITSIAGRDLTVERIDGEQQVSFAYDRKIHLVGPASLLLEYSGSTARNVPAARAE
ncbi:DUF4845 domain-containing protein [Pseudoduganella plicata]|uniref:DUF4845 domain-containing protein n=1 Tax=Pseudoduganella plicata TaxID=321984 RepID=A0A4P7BBK0_9BURK|nr:DUF4845 domain-containing protein [Pseudoduganella plicata]QBQ35854.1 DUF4845 domain-containing protein [Pseudoduganella plicata]GGY94545.1 hypothetical protein GCM10007388_29720 [Pseudoduganella plicata]